MAKQTQEVGGAVDPSGETAIAKIEAPGAMAAPHLIPGMEGIDLRDLQIPRFRLLQPTSQESADHGAGVFLNIVTGEVVKPPLYAIPIRIQKGRLFFGDEEDRELRCRSNDGYTGVGDPGGDCEKCPFSQWGNTVQTGDNEPPPCFRFFGFLVLTVGETPSDDATFTSIGFLNFYRTSEKAGKLWATDLWMNSLATKEPWRRVYAVKVAAIKGVKGLYYKMYVGFARAASEAEMNAAKMWSGLLSSTSVDVAEGAVE